MDLSAEVREYLGLLVEFVEAMAWPAMLAFILLRFKSIIIDWLRRGKKIVLKVAGAEVEFTASEAADALTDVFNEFDVILNSHLTDQEKRLFLKINAASRAPLVKDILPSFKRNSSDHKQLRALRGAYFIRPIEGGRWQEDNHIEITNLGKLVARHKGHLLKSSNKEPMA